mmetsp:Transcript_28991/g.49540  ORF Transcript_28991/g.49540 Transcript_28991/m.49540 type:complete len:123 (-) Transcript_28991:406-774(-)
MADEPVIRFRNYTPRSEELQESTETVAKPVVPAVEEQVDTAEIIHNDATQEPLLNLAPKRANWDLKRDLEPQMKKLRSMTDRAIVQLIAKRVSEEQQSEGQGPDLALAAEQQRKAEAANDDD